MDILNDLIWLIAITLFFIWLSTKSRNKDLIKKYNCKEKYDEINKFNRNNKIIVNLLRIIIGFGSIILGFYSFTLMVFILYIILIIMTFGVIQLAGNGTPGRDFLNFYANLLEIAGNLKFTLGLILIIILIRQIYLNKLNYNTLKIECEKEN